jgi:uncharacterized protein
MFLVGVLLDSPTLMGIGIAMLAGLAVFALVTLPIERNASRRAIAILEQTRLTVAGESAAVRQVLRAAALTYLTGLGQRLAMFLFYVVFALAIRDAQLF